MLALFPLDVVLFPGAPLPLHIFEPRYKEMISECLEQKRPFGMVRAQKEEQFNKQWVVGILAAVALGVLFVLVYTKGKSLFPDRVAQLPEQSNTQQIAVMLYGNYMFTFEIASLLLLVAIIGAVVMAKKRI